MRTQLTRATVEFLDRAVEELDKRQLLDWPRHYRFHYPWQFRRNHLSVEKAREIILELEEMSARNESREQMQPEWSEDVSPQFPTFSEVIEVAPIYKEAVSLEVHKPIVSPNEIPGLLYLLRIPGHQEGVNIENHGFGYHYHYGKLKSDKLIRTNLLLTFDPSLPPPKQKKTSHGGQVPLFFEYHAEGKNKSIDAESIGTNKRRPIYLVCLDIGQKRGFGNFKRPATGSGIFFDSRDHAV